MLAHSGGGVVQIGVLGEFGVRSDAEQAWTLASSRQVGKLGSVLACWPVQVVPDDLILKAMWGPSPPRTAANTLQVHASRLRAVLGTSAAVLRRSGGYLLDIPVGAVDAEEFEGLLAAARGHCQGGDFELAQPLLRRALDLWRGTPFGGLHGVELAARRAHLEELRMAAREHLVLCGIRLAEDAFALDAAVADACALATLAPERGRSQELLWEARTRAAELGQLGGPG